MTTKKSINEGLKLTFDQLEKLRMAQICKLVPDWDKHPASGRVTQAMMDKRGASFRDYYLNTL